MHVLQVGFTIFKKCLWIRINPPSCAIFRSKPWLCQSFFVCNTNSDDFGVFFPLKERLRILPWTWNCKKK
jgi:hypothetical protein